MSARQNRHRTDRQRDLLDHMGDVQSQFYQLLRAREALALRGESLPLKQSEELEYLAARMLDDMDMPVNRKYWGSDPYQRAPSLSYGGRFNAAESQADYMLQNARTIQELRLVARDPWRLAALRERITDDIEARLWLRWTLEEITRHATSGPWYGYGE